MRAIEAKTQNLRKILYLFLYTLIKNRKNRDRKLFTQFETPQSFFKDFRITSWFFRSKYFWRNISKENLNVLDPKHKFLKLKQWKLEENIFPSPWIHTDGTFGDCFRSKILTFRNLASLELQNSPVDWILSSVFFSENSNLTLIRGPKFVTLIGIEIFGNDRARKQEISALQTAGQKTIWNGHYVTWAYLSRRAINTKLDPVPIPIPP